MIDLKKKYKTRDGRSVTLYTVTGKPPYSVHGAIENESATWTDTGRTWNFNTGSEYHQDDLLEVKPEIEGWVNVYASPAPNSNVSDGPAYPGNVIFTCKTEADYWAENNLSGRRDRIACIKIKFTEGEGL
jgi:hypothetical protein